jgi:MraZ protein
MLLGEVVYEVGQKHRLAMPKQFRDELGSVILTRGYEGCLLVVAGSEWQELIADVSRGSMLDANVRESTRFLFGGASAVELDAQGRFIVPATLYDHAQLNDEVVFVGLGRWVEIWDKQRWEEHLAKLGEQGAEIAQHLVDYRHD